MKRKSLGKHKSRRIFKKNTGVHGVNKLNPRKFRGGIRL